MKTHSDSTDVCIKQFFKETKKTIQTFLYKVQEKHENAEMACKGWHEQIRETKGQI